MLKEPLLLLSVFMIGFSVAKMFFSNPYTAHKGAELINLGRDLQNLYDLYDAVKVAKLGLNESQNVRLVATYLNEELGKNVSPDTAKQIYNELVLFDKEEAREAKLKTDYLKNRIQTFKHIVSPFVEEIKARNEE